MSKIVSLTKRYYHKLLGVIRYDNDNNMHHGIMEALEERACDINMGIMKEKIHDKQKMKDIALGNLSGH